MELERSASAPGGQLGAGPLDAERVGSLASYLQELAGRLEGTGSSPGAGRRSPGLRGARQSSQTGDDPTQLVREVSGKMDRLEEVLEQVERSATAPTGTLRPLDRRVAEDLPSLLKDLADRLERLRVVLPGLEQVLGKGVGTRGPQADFSDLPQYLQSLSDRIDILRILLPRFAMILEASILRDTSPAPPSAAAAQAPRRPEGPVPAREEAAERAFVMTPLVASPPRRRFILRESFYSRRRMRALLIPLALLLILFLSGLAWFFNQDFRQQSAARRTVLQMQNASSYRARGLETIADSSGVLEVREEYKFAAPSSVWTRYITSQRQGGAAVSIPTFTGECADREIVVINTARYQLCRDRDAVVFKEWNVDTYDPIVFATLLFQPWLRYAWCRGIDEEPEPQVIDGATTRVFNCKVPNEREAQFMFDNSLSGQVEQRTAPKIATADAEKRQRFVKEASVLLTIWVREGDGYIGRFRLSKSYPGDAGGITQTVDYVYWDFDAVEQFNGPDIEARGQASGSQGEGTQPAGQFQPGLAVLNDRAIQLEVVDERAELERGLALRPDLPENQGMLFVFPRQTDLVFWMKDTLIPLDVIFMDSNFRVVNVQTMQPQIGVPDSELTLYKSSAPAQYALEVNAGVAERAGVRVGQTIVFR